MTDRIAKKAHELWEAEGHPHGRDQEHWERAAALIAMEDTRAAPKKAAAPKMAASEPAKKSAAKKPAAPKAAAKAKA